MPLVDDGLVNFGVNDDNIPVHADINSSSLDKMIAISQMIFSDAFFVNETKCILIDISL